MPGKKPYSLFYMGFYRGYTLLQGHTITHDVAPVFRLLTGISVFGRYFGPHVFPRYATLLMFFKYLSKAFILSFGKSVLIH